MTPSELKHNVTHKGDSPYFFTRDTMRFFGDTMRNYGVRKATVTTRSGETFEAWELYRRKPVKHGLQSSAYFCRQTFNQIHGITE